MARLHLLFLLLVLPLAPRAGILGEEYNVDEVDDYASLPALRLAGEFGFSQWLMPSDSNETKQGKAYYEDFERGWNTSGDAVWYFLSRGGVGLTWIWFLSKASIQDAVLWEGDIVRDRTQRASFSYLGPSFWTRMRAGRFGLVHAGFGAGRFAVLETWTDNGIPNRVTAKTYALVTSLGYDYTLMRTVGLGVNGRFFFSNIVEYTINGETVKVVDTENKYSAYNIPMYRLELNVGLRFYLF